MSSVTVQFISTTNHFSLFFKKGTKLLGTNMSARIANVKQIVIRFSCSDVLSPKITKLLKKCFTHVYKKSVHYSLGKYFVYDKKIYILPLQTSLKYINNKK